ncbi:TnsA endonuclease N-terminal domain-containing protein [Bacillus sp. ISL-57]|uniref:TnsA endonuclease N-terminal domain-containing protein n=1 Tax=Bacillus sp. ISL-57 TaxID=2819135 RepID=UPI001BE6FD0B|nr:TnsA endonuclease N-terminal domain-containing protein [Bacillus sp. ISL-57]MBT2716958.1 TnsA endonuclease N-terminal domain-containing protein [Bacillus sp. ISL-57]
MDWTNYTWENEDKLYSPKRKVNNKRSHFIKHLSGFLPSYKMNRSQIGYESFWGECLFYYYLELDPQIIRYYEQPIEVPIVTLNENNEIKVWTHVPDVLVFRQGYKPLIIQIKGSDKEVKQLPHIERACNEFAAARDWSYITIYPKQLPDVIKSNILFLSNYMRPRSYFVKWEQELLQKLLYRTEISVIELAKGFSSKGDYRVILPLIYHLIAKGKLKVNINIDINDKSIVQLGNISDDLKLFIQEEK